MRADGISCARVCASLCICCRDDKKKREDEGSAFQVESEPAETETPISGVRAALSDFVLVEQDSHQGRAARWDVQSDPAEILCRRHVPDHAAIRGWNEAAKLPNWGQGGQSQVSKISLTPAALTGSLTRGQHNTAVWESVERHVTPHAN